MDHNFVFGGIDPAKCAKCKHTFIEHSDAATCESCGRIGKINLFGAVSNPKHMLLCAECERKEIDAAVSLTINTPAEVQQSRIDEMNERINLAKEQDSLIRYNGDVFNAPTIPNEEIRKLIFTTEMSEQERKETFHNFMQERIQHFQKVVFRTLAEVEDTDKFTKHVVHQNLRDLAYQMYREMSERIKKEDANYVSTSIKAVKPKVKKETLGTYDRLVQMYMGMHNCTKEQAIEAITKGSGGKLTNELPK